MKRMNITAAVSAAAMLINLLLPFAFAEENKSYIYLSSAADIIELANNCMIDSYSTGRTVVLKMDIDMSGSGFDCIGYFNGEFDGAGYTISGVNLEVSDPERGFIGIVGTEGIIKNLNIRGEISQKEENKTENKLKIIDSLAENISTSAERFVSDSGVYTVGGICGINKGFISGCTFEGSVKVSRNAGGICGINEITGRIESSINKGNIKGDENIGGICGKNDGLIKWCFNEGKVNDEPNEAAKNTGGIAGTSNGAVLQSSNNGVIGYKNTGTNTGGITGCQSGLVSECENKAQVYGKKETGGISGRFEPFVNIDFNQDELGKRIEKQKEQLKSDLDSIQSDMENSAQKIRDNYAELRNGLFPGLGGSSLLGALSGLGSGSASLIDSLRSVADSLISLNNALGGTVDGVDLRGSVDSLKSFTDSADSAMLRLADNADSLSEDMRSSNDEIKSLIDEVSKAVSNGDVNRSELTDELSKKISELELEIPEMNMDVGGVNIDGVDLRETDYALSRAIQDIGDILGDDIEDMFAPLLKISQSINDIYTSVEERKKALEEAKRNLEKLLEDLKSNMPTLPPINSGEETPGTAQPTVLPIITEAPDNNSVLGNLFSFLETAAYAEDGTDKTTLQRLADMDIHDMDIQVMRTIAGEEFDSALIKYCINSGAVTGVTDAGGIAGAVGFEIAINENINKNGTISLNPSTAVKAVISTCINEGDITAKNTSAGGITGFSDLGSVKESINTGSIEVTEGSYSGGITGYHLNNITRCISIGDLKGTSDIGGIAGKGTNIEGCYALARTDSTGERSGAIAGSTMGTVKYNYFLKESMGGINGVDYKEKAQGVSKDILARNGSIASELKGFDDEHYASGEGDLYMPQLKAFTENSAESLGNELKAKSADAALFKFKAVFVVDGSEIKTVKLDYGDKIPEQEIPVLEKRKGQFGVWDKDTEQEIVRNTIFTAIYSQSTSTLSYGGEPPILLTEGNFNPEAVLEVREYDAKSIVNDRIYEPKRGYELKITEGSREYDDPITVRIRDENGKNTKIGVIENGAVVITETERDGSYVKFEMASPGEFIVLRQKNGLIAVFMSIAAVILLLALLFTIFRKHRNKKSGMEDRLGEGMKLSLLGRGKEAPDKNEQEVEN